MFSAMENIDRAPDSAAAQDALDEVDSAQRAVRDTAWPTWLYPVNAVLIGAMALTALLDDYRLIMLLAVSFASVGVNMAVGYRTGVPRALPTSRGFLASVAVAVACILAAWLAADLTDRAWPVVALAASAAGSYLIGSVAHRRSTSR